MIEQKKPNSVDLYIQKIRASLMAEFGSIELPLEVQVLIRNRASEDGISTIQALDALISENGSLSNVTEVAKKMLTMLVLLLVELESRPIKI